MPVFSQAELMKQPQTSTPGVVVDDKPEGAFTAKSSIYEAIGAFFSPRGGEFVPSAYIASSAESIIRLSEVPDDSFDPYDAIKGTKWEAYGGEFIDVYNRAQFDRKIQKLEDEQLNRDIIERSSFATQLVAGAAVGVADPTNWIAFGGPIAKGLIAGTRAMAAREYFISGAKSGLMSGVAQEAVLQEANSFRTWQESVANVGMSTALTGGLGGVVGRSVGKRAEEAALAKSARAALDARLAASPEVVARVQAEVDTAATALNLGLPVMPDDVKARITDLEGRAGILERQAATPRPASETVVPGVMSIGEDGVGRAVARATPEEDAARAAALRAEAETLRSPYAEPPAAANVSRETPDNVVPLNPSDALPRVSRWSSAEEGGMAVGGKSLSAAATPGAGIIRLQGGKFVEFLQAPSRFLGRWVGWFDSPVGRGLTSPLQSVRAITERLANTLRLTKNQDTFVDVIGADGLPARYEAGHPLEGQLLPKQRVSGEATAMSVEAAVGRYQGMQAAVLRKSKSAYLEYRRERAGRTAPQVMERARIAAADAAGGMPAGTMTELQFRAAAYDVIRDGTPSGIKQVDDLAAELQKQMDELTAQAIAVRAMDPNASQTTARNWIMRVYDREYIKANKPLAVAIARAYYREVAAKLQADADEARKIVADLEGQREALLAEMSPDEQRVYLAEGKVREAENRYDEAVAVREKAVAAYNAAADRAAVLRKSPEVGRMQDTLAAADQEAGLAAQDVMAADIEIDAAKAARDAARNTFKIYENTTQNWPVALERAKIERRNAAINVLRAQSYQARRALLRLEEQLQAHGGSIEEYRRWLDLRSASPPRAPRPLSLVEYITSKGKDGNQVPGIRIWVEDAEGNRVVTSEGSDYLEIVKDYLKTTKAGTTDVRDRLSRLISDDPRAPTVGEASERFRKFIDDSGDMNDGLDEYSINDFLSAVASDLSGLKDGAGVVNFGNYAKGGVRRSHEEVGRIYDTDELDAVLEWAEWDSIRERKRDIEYGGTFQSARDLTRTLNSWREQAAKRYDAVERDLLETISERNKLRDALDARVSRARELEKNRNTLDERIEKEKKRAEQAEGIAEKSDAELDARSVAAWNEVLGVPGEITAWAAESAGARGPLADRTFLIPDDFDAGPITLGGVTYSGRFDQFIVKDTDRVMAAMARNMGPDIELYRAFGGVNLKKQFQEIADDATALMNLELRRQETDLLKPLDPNVDSTNMSRAEWEAVPRVKDDPKAAERIKARTAKRNRQIEDEAKQMRDLLQAQVDTLRGTYTGGVAPDQLWVRAFEDIKAVNNLSLMGGTVPSSIADPFLIANHFSMGELIRGIRAAITDWPAFKAEMQRIGSEVGQANDLTMSVRSNKSADMSSTYIPNNRVSATLHWLSQRMGNVSLLGPWTDFWKTIDVMLAQNRILTNSEKYVRGEDIGDVERAFMRDHFLDESAMVQIAQMQPYVKKVGSLRVAESGNWSSDEARRLFTAAMNKNADFNVITPGLDKPLWMRTPLGSVIGQFKSFSFVSMSRTIAANVQRGEAQAYLGMALLVQGGALSYLISSVLKGEDPFEEPPEKWAAEAIDRSGLVGYMGEINAMADKFGIGINTLAGFKPNSRYASRGPIDQILGPTFGRFANLVNVGQALGSSEIDLTGKDIGNLRSLIFFQNVPLVPRYLMDSVERGVAESLGIEPRPAVQKDREAE